MFTDRNLRTLKPLNGKPFTRYWDKATTGLCVHVGAKSIAFYCKAGGKMYPIGRFPEWTIPEARERCKEIRRLVGEGRDPNPRPAEALMSLSKAFGMFEVARLSRRRPATRKEYRRLMEQYVFERWGDVPIDKLARREMVELHVKLTGAGIPPDGKSRHRSYLKPLRLAVCVGYLQGGKPRQQNRARIRGSA